MKYEDAVERYRKSRSRWINYVVTCKFGDIFSFVARRNNMTLTDFINNAIKYYMEREFQEDYQLAKINAASIEERKACGKV